MSFLKAGMVSALFTAMRTVPGLDWGGAGTQYIMLSEGLVCTDISLCHVEMSANIQHYIYYKRKKIDIFLK